MINPAYGRRKLTTAQLRAAAAGRPGYATYPEYQTGQPERLAWDCRDDLKPPVDAHRETPPVPAGTPSADVDQATPRPGPLVDRVVMRPVRVPDRPWWRPCWHWLVWTRTGLHTGYTWTEAGARRRTARYSSAGKHR